jgi:fucose-1-phosphate guanylyltransferase
MFLGQTIDKELDSTFWDVVVLTAADEAQKNVYEKQLKYKYERQELPVNVEIIVVADPPGPKIGNLIFCSISKSNSTYY